MSEDGEIVYPIISQLFNQQPNMSNNADLAILSFTIVGYLETTCIRKALVYFRINNG